MARSTDDPKRAPIQRMSPIKNHDLVGEGFVSLTRWGIPEPPRLMVWMARTVRALIAHCESCRVTPG